MDICQNKRAYFDFELLEKLSAGLVLSGTEIKSLRQKKGANLDQSYVRIIKNEAFLIGATIPPYSHGNIHNHEQNRDRKLLLHRKEIDRILEAVSKKGLTTVALRLFLHKGLAKLEIAIARGRKQEDKRQHIKDREEKRSLDRATRH